MNITKNPGKTFILWNKHMSLQKNTNINNSNNNNNNNDNSNNNDNNKTPIISRSTGMSIQ